MGLCLEWVRRCKVGYLVEGMLLWEGCCALNRRDVFKVVSYNILSERYAGSSKHDYCPGHLRTWETRLPKILAVVVESDADVVCLQEVTPRAFREDLRPAFGKRGFKGYLSRDRLGSTRTRGSHFLAVFVRLSVFVPKDIRGYCLKDHYVHGWTEKKLAKKLRGLNDTMMICKLQHWSGREVIIANIHVHFDPDHAQVKTSQVHIATWLIHSFNDKQIPAPVVFCGDFNSMPLLDRTRISTGRFPSDKEHSGVFALLLGGKLEHAHPEHPCHYGRSSAAFRDLSRIPLLKNRYKPLADVYGDARSDAVTSQTDNFKGRIDHIFFEQHSGIASVQRLKLPTGQELGSIPNDIHPSDHVPVGAAFVFEGKERLRAESHDRGRFVRIAFVLLVLTVLASLVAVPNDILGKS